MRTGAIFARGSCRALKWVALVGMVFALGGGQALAQDAEVDIKLGTNRPAEGGALVTVTVTVDPSATATVPGSLTVTLTLASDPATDTDPPSDTRGELGDNGDIAWEGATRASATTTLEFSWGDSRATTDETVNLRTYRDSDAEDEKFTVTSTGGDGDTEHGDPVKFTVIDAETQTYVLSHPYNNSGEIDEGMDPTLELAAWPLKTGPVRLRVTLDSENGGLEDYSLSTDTASISEEFTIPVAADTDDANRAGVVWVPFVTEDVDGDRVDDTVTFKVTYADGDMRGSAAMDEYYTLKVIDQHKLPKITLGKIQVPDKDDKLQDADSIPEGKIGTVTLTADRSPDDVPSSEDIKVTLRHSDGSTADTRDYTLGGSPVEIDGSDKSATFTINVDADEDVGLESLVLEAVVTGTDANGPNPDSPYDLKAIPFSDETDTQITPKSDDMIYAAIMAARTDGAGGNGLWTPGETMSLEASDFFTWNTTMYNVVLGNAISDDQQIATAGTTNDSLTITAVGDGMTEISVTGTAMAAPSSVMSSQTVSNVATVKFPVTVDPPAIVAKDNAQAVAGAAVAVAAADSANGIWEPAPNGAVAMVAVSDLFDVPESIKAEYLSRSSDNADVMAAISSDMMNVELTPMGAGMATITVTAVDTERPGNAVSVEFDVTVMAQAAVRAMSQDDVNKVFMDAGADDLVAQGAAISVDMSKLFEVGSGVTPGYSAESSMADVLMASASGMMLTLTPGQGPAGGMSTITVTALDSASGSHASVMYMATVDALPAMITVSTDPMDMVAEGGAITVTAMLNQEATADMTVKLQVTGPATPAEAEIMLMTGMESASTMLMADDDYDHMSDWNDIVIVASHAAIMGGSAVMTLSVTENDSEITYTLMEPAETNLVEGSEYELTVTAEPAVAMDTEVTIILDRANSDADADDYTVEPITIMAGETSGSTMLMVTEDNMDDSGHASPEMLTLFGMVGNMQTNSVSVYLWDMAVPALPLIAQLLLAAFLAIGGYRRYLRR